MLLFSIINIPGVAGADLQTPPSFIYWLSQSSFSAKSSKLHKSQTIRARDLKCLHDLHLLSRVMCHVSGVRRHMSHVTIFFSLFFLLFLQTGWAIWWRVCYQQRLPRLVYRCCIKALLVFTLKIQKKKTNLVLLLNCFPLIVHFPSYSSFMIIDTCSMHSSIRCIVAFLQFVLTY